ncbi:serine/threonine protein kinase [Microbacterium sp. SORGH_AS428]|uniref:serine/threonine-protein kinase n=1 Tax=Microbacterium sp. SORGH_AS_0428 TaxID=3041788 RepID=UPI00285CFDC7|nr:serine/threonine-protein kinase [Microbacterium sp. SORGH_AS_0428]MDR6201233.1 serine/threonine protein kinase [Microbacterium sp. SORGH_AS_0428]
MVGTAVAGAFSATSAHFLGTGTYGETWCVRGIDGQTDDYAVKLLKPEFFNPARVQREIQGLQRFDHRGIVRLIEVRTVAIDGEPRTALVCEYIQGGSVQDALTQGTLPSKKDAKKFARGLLEAVAELHREETIHRDIKPANIMLRDGDWAQPVLIDFGLARSLSDKTFTRYPAKVGSLLWMSPEQLSAERARKASDIWACGIVLQQVLTGDHPFVNMADLSGLDEDELYDLFTVPPKALPDGAPGSLAVLVGRFLTAEPLYARGTAQRAIADLKGK